MPDVRRARGFRAASQVKLARYVPVITGMLCVAIAAIMFQSAAHEQPVPLPAREMRARPVVSQSARLSYPADRLPILTLPDGERRRISSVLNVTKPLRFGDYVWNDAGVPAGRVWVRIDLAHQTMSVFRDGHEIGSTVILYGTDGKPTPSGMFHVIEKAERHRSSLYDAEMPFMLRLTGDGVAIHASNVHEGSATHGCIGIPVGIARLLFAQVRRGDTVAILPASVKVL